MLPPAKGYIKLFTV